MTSALDELYRRGHERVDARVRSLIDDGRSPDEIGVPACPGWSVHGVVSHLSGIPVDALSGRLKGIPDDEWTAGQVAERAGWSTGAVLDEWAAHVDGFATAVASMAMIPPVADVLTHEGDIAEALGDPVPGTTDWVEAMRLLGSHMIPAIDLPGSLTITAGPDSFAGGSGGDGPATSVDVPPWELFRALLSRRSGAQMRAWPWTGDPEPWLERLTVFGVRDDDQPRAGATT